MVHIATVHFGTDKWIDIQQRYLHQHLKGPFRIYAWFNDVVPSRLDPYYFTCFEPVLEHEIKLNILGDIICASAGSADDILIFLDGDAFPIADLNSFLAAKLAVHELAAIQRRENNGDIQPHPCFCATTVGFWKKIKGDWKRGYQWKNAQGELVTDVGGNLLQQLEARQTNWYPLLRSNRRNCHPLLFGVYDSLIYHHGAGFRTPMTRQDTAALEANANALERTLSVVPWYRRKLRRKTRERNNFLSDEIFKNIQQAGNSFTGEFL